MSNPLLLRVAFWVGVVGFVASLAVHLATFVGVPVPGSAAGLHVGVFVAFVPVLFAARAWVQQRGYDFDDIASQRAFQRELFGLLPGWQKVALGVLFVYAVVNFAVGFAGVLDAPDSGLDFRMFSGHWMVFYAVSAAFARRLLALREDGAEGMPDLT